MTATNVIQLSTSRHFLIGQAVLNAANEFYPLGVSRFGIAKILRMLITGSEVGLRDFHQEVKRQYSILTGTYSEAQVEDDCAFTDPDFIAAVNGAFHT